MKYTLKISPSLKNVIEIETATTDILIHEENLSKHMLKSRHHNMVHYIPQVSSILTHPDYIGRNKNIKSDSFEVIKILEDNVLVAVKLDRKNDYFYVASVYDVTDSKLEHMKKSGRIKEFDSQAKL